MKSDDDFKLDFLDDVNAFLAKVASGEISAEQAERELDIAKAFSELILIATEMGPRPTSADEKMRRDEKMIALWPEACRRAGVQVMDMPTDLLRTVADLRGRPS